VAVLRTAFVSTVAKPLRIDEAKFMLFAAITDTACCELARKPLAACSLIPRVGLVQHLLLPLWLGLLIFHPFSGTINLTFINRVIFQSFQQSDYLSSFINLSHRTHFLHRPGCAKYLLSHIKAKTWAFSLQML
jgi:hypothetical protein